MCYAVCYAVVLGQAALKHIGFLHGTECVDAQLCEKWTKEGSKELFILPEEFSDRHEKYLHLVKHWEMSLHGGTLISKYCTFYVLYIKI